MFKLLTMLMVVLLASVAVAADIHMGYAAYNVSGHGQSYKPYMDSIPGSIFTFNWVATMGANMGYHDISVDVFRDLYGLHKIWDQTKYHQWIEENQVTVFFFNE